MTRSVLSILSSLMAVSLFAGTATYDFTAGTAEEVAGWDLMSARYDGVNGQKIEDDGQSVGSPFFTGSVVRIQIAVRCMNMKTDSPSAVTVLGRNTVSGEWWPIETMDFLNGGETNMSCKILRALDCRQIRLRFDKRSGTLRIKKFTATWREPDEVEVPHDLVVSALSTNACTFSWQNDDPVDGYRCYLWHETQSDWQGEVVWAETFAGCRYGGGNPKDITGELDGHTDRTGWEGAFLYAPTGGVDMIQINKATSSTGWLVSPLLPEMTNVALAVRARAQTEQPDQTMPVYLIRGGETNELGRFDLTTELADYALEDVLLQRDDRIAFRSFVVGSQRRVLMDAVRFVANYVPPKPVTNWIERGTMTSHAEWCATGLVVGTVYRFSVEAVSEGAASGMSDFCQVTMPSETYDLSAISLMELERRNGNPRYAEDFSGSTNMYRTSDNVAVWRNGLTLPSWQLFRGGSSVTNLSRNYGAATVSGFYMYWATNELVETYALGTLTSEMSGTLVYGVPFHNDLDRDVSSVSIGYKGKQFGFKNSVPQQLYCEYLVSNRLVSVSEAGDWRGVEQLTYTTAMTSESGRIAGKDLPDTVSLSAEGLRIRIPQGAYLHVRWRRPPVVGAAAMAIDDLEITFQQSGGTIFVVR